MFWLLSKTLYLEDKRAKMGTVRKSGGSKKGSIARHLLASLVFAEREGLATTQMNLLRLTPFPSARRRGPCKERHSARSYYVVPLFSIPPSTSKLAP